MHIEGLCVSYLLQQYVSTLSDRLIIIYVSKTGDKVVDIELFLELEVENLTFVTHHNIDVNLLLLDFRKHAIHVMEIVRVNGRLQFFFVLGDNGCTFIAAADKAFLGFRGVCLEYPVATRALDAEEILAAFAEVPDVFEIEYGIAAYSSRTLFGIHSLEDQIASAIVGGQIKGRVRSSVDLVHIDTAHQETLEDFVSTTSCCLMDRSVAVHVNLSWRKILLK